MVFIADSLKRPNGWLCSISNAASTFSSASVADVLEITTQFTGNGVCEAYFAVGQLV
jgi:hypothetical protein